MAGDSSTLLRGRWKKLLSWLEAHGFPAHDLAVDCREMTFAGNGLFACNVCAPGSLLFVIPPTVLMNKMTLKRLYPPDLGVVKALTAIQLISMHLFLWRPNTDEDSADPSFGPYISILPRDFGNHPLTWLVLSKFDRADDLRISLLNRLPPSVLAALHCLHTRFWDDWCRVRALLRRVPSIAQRPLNVEAFDAIMNFLWAWLNVNTRCIYYRLKHDKADPDNVTMCPIVDFANHTSGQACMVLVPSDFEGWNTAPNHPLGDGLKFVCSDNVEIEKDDEILLTYGHHSNRKLFVEYGFVDVFPDNGLSSSGEVDVQDLVETHVFSNAHLREVVEPVLIAEGYWGDWTLHLTPNGVQPSWRLIIALRLYHLVVTVGSADRNLIQIWQDVIMGKRSCVSCENERSWRKTVVLLCDKLIERAERSVAMGSVTVDKEGGVDCAAWMSENIQSLWREELLVAREVKKSILRGDEF